MRPFFGKNLTMRQTMTRSAIATVLALGGLAGLGFWWNEATAPAAGSPPAPPLPVETITVTPTASFTQQRTFAGVVKAMRTSDLGFERTGRVITILVTEGDRVAAGQPLAHLDAENLQAKRRELEAQRNGADSLLRELIAGPRQQTIDATRAEVRDLESQVELAELNFERRERLLASRATSREEYENASLGLRSSTAQLDAAQRRLDELEAGTRQERIDAQRAIVAQLDASLANIEIDIEESTLRAPFAGMIGRRFHDEGTIVATGSPLFRLVEDQRLEAWIGMPAELAAGRLDAARMELTIGHRTFPATLQAVLPELDPATRTRMVIFRLAETAGILPGQVARVEVDVPVESAGFRVPTTSLARGSRGLWSVLVVEPANDASEASGQSDRRLVAVRRDVEMLHTDGREVLVRGTLNEGDVVITSAHRVVAGQAVQPMETAAFP